MLWILKLNGFEFLKKTEYFSSVGLILIQIVFFCLSVIIFKFKNMKSMIKIPGFYIALIIVFMSAVCGSIVYFFGKQTPQFPLLFLLVPAIIIMTFGMIYLYDLLAEFYQQKVIWLSEKKKRENQDEKLKQVEKDVEEMKQF